MANGTVKMPVVNTKKQKQGSALEMPVVNTKKQRASADTVKADTSGQKNAAQQTGQTNYREVDPLPNIANTGALGAGNYGADKQANEGYNYGKGLLKAGGMGLSAIARDVTTPLAFGERTVAKGWNALFGNIAPMNERGFFNAWDENIAFEQEGLQQKYAENTAKGGQYAEKGENLLASAVEALPSLAIAFASGGTSAAAKAGTLAAQTAAKSSPALVQTLKNVAAARAKDPNYLSSAAQIFSHSYNDAKTEGVDDKRAALYAIGNALLGSEIEISGGIQNLPGKVANQAAWRTLVNTMLDEGKEEVLQGIIDRTLQNAVYDADNPYFGVNENAIFDPGTAAEEFAGGAIVGGLLGMHVDDPRLRDSLEIARQQGMDVRFEQVNLRGAHPNTVRLHVTGERGTALTLEAASVGGGNIEIHRINGLSVNFTGKADTMIIHHIDMPGAIAAVTSTLARHRVNIANMQVYRRKLGGDAMMVLELDGAPSQADLDIIRQIPDIRSCTFLKRRDD